MAQHDYNIANASFPTVRSDINDVLSAINTSNSGSSRPSSAVVGTIWLDTTSATAPTLKYYDGAGDISLATLDHSANTVNWLDSTVVADLLNDTTPQLGGQLDVNGNAIGNGTLELLKFIETASAVNEVTVTNSATSNAPELSATGDDTNIDLKLTPKGSGKLNLDGIKFPNADGSANQILTTNGSGVLSFADAGGGTSWQSAVKTANFTAVAGEGYFVNTAGGAFEIDLPSSPSVGDEIEFVDFTRNFATANLTLDQGSNKFQSNTSPKPVYSTDGQNIKIVYSGSTQGWIPLVDDDVTFETSQNYDIEFLVVAGGGSGGSGSSGSGYASGGGGAGGYRTSTQSVLPASGGITITIGAGGATSDGNSGGHNGVASSISGSGITTISSAGGGRGGSSESSNDPYKDGADGGSGGGVGSHNGGSGGDGNTPSTSPSQGNNGGNVDAVGTGGTGNTMGAGGGGASAVGQTIPSTNNAGAGGAGTASSITGSSVTRAGGGGGGAGYSGGTANAGAGGAGGGGAGSNSGAGTAGTTNTGGGGGGAKGGSQGGAGGSGVVILSMLDGKYSGTTTGSPTVATGVSGKTVLTFTGSGSYTR